MRTSNLTIQIAFLLLLVTSVFTQSCGKKETELPIISVENIVRNKISLQDITDDIIYVKLENMPLLGQINAITSTDSLLFINDLNRVYKFNINGKFIGEVGKRGNGPKEYNRSDDIAIDSGNQLLFIRGYNNIYVYDFEGNFKKTFETFDNVGFDKMMLNNHILYFANGYNTSLTLPEYSWVTTDENGKVKSIKKSDKVVNKQLKNGVSYKKSLLFDIDDNIFYWNSLDDTILQVQNNKKVPAFVFAKDKFRLTKEDLHPDKFINKTSWQLNTVLGTNKYLLLEYVLIKDKKYIYSLFDIKSNTLHEISSINFNGEIDKVNSYDGGPPFALKAKINVNNETWFVNWIDAFQLIALINSDAFKNSTPKYPEKKKQLEQLANNLDVNDNPVLMLVKLKE